MPHTSKSLSYNKKQDSLNKLPYIYVPSYPYNYDPNESSISYKKFTKMH